MPVKHKILLTYDPDGELERIIGREFSQDTVNVLRAFNSADLARAIVGTDILFGNELPSKLIPTAPKLRWIQTPGAGIDKLISPELRASGIAVTNSRSAFSDQIAEHVLAMILAFGRGIINAITAQQTAVWRPVSRSSLIEMTGKVIGIVGYGDVGCAIGKRAKALGMTVLAVRRRNAPATESEIEILPVSRLHAFLPRCDFIINTLPLTSETRKLFGRVEFGLMKPTARFINVGRGETVDQIALIHALEHQLIAGAGLDVTDPEPLPASSPLWTLNNVLITAHYAGWSENMLDKIYAIFLDNLARFRDGRPLRNLVDLETGC